MSKKLQFPQDFFNKVYIPFSLDEDVCWPWVGPSIAPTHYGLFGGKNMASRTVLEQLFNVRFNQRTDHACHSCDHPPCVRPSHLFFGTCKDNRDDASRKGRLKQSEKTKQKRVFSNAGRVVSKRTRNKISLSLKGKATWMKGRTHSLESRQKMSRSLKGRSVWNKGIPRSEEVKEKIRQTLLSRRAQ